MRVRVHIRVGKKSTVLIQTKLSRKKNMVIKQKVEAKGFCIKKKKKKKVQAKKEIFFWQEWNNIIIYIFSQSLV